MTFATSAKCGFNTEISYASVNIPSTEFLVITSCQIEIHRIKFSSFFLFVKLFDIKWVTSLHYAFFSLLTYARFTNIKSGYIKKRLFVISMMPYCYFYLLVKKKNSLRCLYRLWRQISVQMQYDLWLFYVINDDSTVRMECFYHEIWQHSKNLVLTALLWWSTLILNSDSTPIVGYCNPEWGTLILNSWPHSSNGVLLFSNSTLLIGCFIWMFLKRADLKSTPLKKQTG